MLTDLVRAEAAAVLGHASPRGDRAGACLQGAGLRLADRALNCATGWPPPPASLLPATLVYDHPNPAALARYLWDTESARRRPRDPLVAELDRLESLFSNLTQDGGAREMAGNRLKRLLAKLTDATSQEDGQVVARRIESATDDEIINFIHAELGR